MASGHVDHTKPLRPLTEHAWEELARIGRGPVFPHTVNPGVRGRFFREELIEQYQGRGAPLLRITPAGVAKLAERA